MRLSITLKNLGIAVAALLACGCAGKPELSSLLVDIKSHSLQKREVAADALEDLGEPAIGPLRRLASLETTVDEKRRLLDIVEEIERLRNVSPPRSGYYFGVSTKLRLGRRNLIAGDSVELVFELTSDAPFSVAKVTSTSMLYDQPLTAMQMTLAHGEVKFELECQERTNPTSGVAQAVCIRNIEASVVTADLFDPLTIKFRIPTGRTGDQNVLLDGTYKIRAYLNLLDAGSPLLKSNWDTLYVSE